MKYLLAVCLVLSTVACGSSNNNSAPPTAPTPPAPTRVINVTGDLNFGQLTVGDSLIKNMTIANSGTGTLTVSGMTGPCGNSFAVSWASGTISAGASQAVSVRYAPTAAQSCNGVVTVNGDQTAGTNTLAVTASAVAGYSHDLTGRWRGNVGADTIITLTQTGSSLSGTFDSINLKGNVSGLTGQADDAGNSISGQVNGSGFQNTPFTVNRI
jgi:hypothetical protein